MLTMDIVRRPEEVKRILWKWAGYIRELTDIHLRVERSLERLRELSSDAALLSGITQRYETMDMPRGSDVTDKTGGTAARRMEAREKEQVRLQDLRLQEIEISAAIDDIERIIAVLDQQHADAIRWRYRYRVGWQKAVDELHISRATYFRLLEEATDALTHVT